MKIYSWRWALSKRRGKKSSTIVVTRIKNNKRKLRKLNRNKFSLFFLCSRSVKEIVCHLIPQMDGKFSYCCLGISCFHFLKCFKFLLFLRWNWKTILNFMVVESNKIFIKNLKLFLFHHFSLKLQKISIKNLELHENPLAWIYSTVHHEISFISTVNTSWLHQVCDFIQFFLLPFRWTIENLDWNLKKFSNTFIIGGVWRVALALLRFFNLILRFFYTSITFECNFI